MWKLGQHDRRWCAGVQASALLSGGQRTQDTAGCTSLCQLGEWEEMCVDAERILGQEDGQRVSLGKLSPGFMEQGSERMKDSLELRVALEAQLRLHFSLEADVQAEVERLTAERAPGLRVRNFD